MEEEQVVVRADCCSSESKDLIGMKKIMIDKLVQTNAHFKHQIRGEPELDIHEKYTIASDLFEKNIGLFLERFSDNLTFEDIDCFSDVKDDYVVSFYLNKIKDAHQGKNKTVVKNRRYQALQEMMEEGEYFSETEMQSRNPLLYDQLVGQFETEEEKQAKDIDKTDLRFSSILLKYMDKQEMKSRYEIMKEREEEQEEEEDTDTEDEEDENNDDDGRVDDKEKGNENANDNSEVERVEMRHEFLRIMQDRFLSGEDSQFDYSKVDGNTQYDSFALLNQDAEEKYFDTDDAMDADCCT